MLNVFDYKITQFEGKVTNYKWFKIYRTFLKIPVKTIETWSNNLDEAKQIVEWHKELIKENRI